MTGFLKAFAVAVLLAAGASGCVVVRKGVEAMTAPFADNLTKSLQKESDLQLVKDAVPAYLLLLDALVESSPDSARVLLAAADAQTAYATAFVDKAEAARAADMYAKARDYGLRVLCRNRKFRKVHDQPLDRFETALPSFRKRDVPALYTTATAWSGWIISKSDSMAALAELSKAMALMKRVYQLDPGYQHGGPDMFFGIYYAVQPRGGGQDLQKSKEHFERAFLYAGDDLQLPRVAYAEFYARYAFDRELFEKTLKGVTEHKTSQPSLTLMNEVARKRAEVLLEKADELF
ncbi:MAG: TRAP transporter TatT component family protein [Verrucomicrobiota bacterium]